MCWICIQMHWASGLRRLENTGAEHVLVQRDEKCNFLFVEVKSFVDLFISYLYDFLTFLLRESTNTSSMIGNSIQAQCLKWNTLCFLHSVGFSELLLPVLEDYWETQRQDCSWMGWCSRETCFRDFAHHSETIHVSSYINRLVDPLEAEMRK